MPQDPKTLLPERLGANYQSLYPQLDTLDEVIDLAIEALPVMDQNTLYALLIIYHNTLIGKLTP